MVPSEDALTWERLRPMLDEAITTLSEADRIPLLLRFFKDQDFRAVGFALCISDDAAQKRVARAVELRGLLRRRGFPTTSAALAASIAAQGASARADWLRLRNL